MSFAGIRERREILLDASRYCNRQRHIFRLQGAQPEPTFFYNFQLHMATAPGLCRIPAGQNAYSRDNAVYVSRFSVSGGTSVFCLIV